MSNQIDHLKKNIAKLSVIVTSGHFPDFQSVERDGESVWTTKLSDYQMHGHIGALIENLKEFSNTINDSWTSCK